MDEETYYLEMKMDEYLVALMNGASIEADSAERPDSEAHLALVVLVGLGLVTCEVDETIGEDGLVVRTEVYSATEELKKRMEKIGKFSTLFVDSEGTVIGDQSSQVH